MITDSLYLLSEYKDGPIIILISSAEMEDTIDKLNNAIKSTTDHGYSLWVYTVSNWDSMLTPWQYTDPQNSRIFEGKGEELLKKLECEIVNKIDYNLIYKNRDKYLIGYSLAGLFSLWSIYESKIFNGCASVSGSLWYPGWGDYIEKNVIEQKNNVYISLGKKEANSRNNLMKNVLTATEKQYELLKKDTNVSSVKYVLNEGGHFSNIEDRIVDGINWLINANISGME